MPEMLVCHTFVGMTTPPVIAGLPVSDLRLSVEETVKDLAAHDTETGVFTVYRLTNASGEEPGPALMALLTEGGSEDEFQHEAHNMAIMFFYLRDTILPILKSNGLWMAPDPAPLSAEQVKYVFGRLVETLPENKRTVTFRTRTKDNKLVEFRQGEVIVSDL
jgi:hypothetical protein